MFRKNLADINTSYMDFNQKMMIELSKSREDLKKEKAQRQADMDTNA